MSRPAARTSSAAPVCPVTGTRGRPVHERTVLALVPGTVSKDPPGRSWYYCTEPTCSTVYFDDSGRTIDKTQLKVRVGEKEATPPHTVCYCFGHTVEEIEADIVRQGSTTIPDSINAKVQAGECSCETMNPKGTCCLGDVGAVVKRAIASAGADALSASGSDEACDVGSGGGACCAAATDVVPEPPTDTPRRATKAALGLSALTALGASACCWLPLLLAVLGASSVGVAGTFEGMRPYLLVIAPLFLGFSFYMLYLRRSPCEEGSSCATTRGSGSRAAKVFFWFAASLLVASLAFPSAMASLLGGSAPVGAERLGTLPTLELHVEGMTCESCSASARKATRSVRGVVDAAADHEGGTVTVWFEPGSKPNVDAISKALAVHGYEVVENAERPPQSDSR